MKGSVLLQNEVQALHKRSLLKMSSVCQKVRVQSHFLDFYRIFDVCGSKNGLDIKNVFGYNVFASKTKKI